MKTFKQFLTEKGISEEAWKAKSAEEMAALHKEYNEACQKEIEDAIQNKTSKKDVQGMITKALEGLDGFATSEQVTKLTASMKEISEAVQEIKTSGKAAVAASLKEQIVNQIKENLDGFEALKKDKNASFQLELKAPADMLISTNTTGRVARTEVDPERTRVVRRNPFILDLVNKGTTKAKTIYWVEQENPDGTPAMTAEGAVKSQIDWDYVERSAQTRKITAFTKVSKEMLDDIDGFAQDVADEIIERVELVADTQVLTGDGTGENMIGIAANATPFTAGSLLNTVPGADNTAVLRAGLAQVRRSEFDATHIVIHPDKAAAMDLEVGSDGHYKLPPFTSADGTKVKGVPVAENTGVGVDDFYVGDFNKYKFKLREGISISIGYDGNDWTKNMLTPLGEMRGAGYIKANHYGAIVKGDFTSAKALLDPNVTDPV